MDEKFTIEQKLQVLDAAIQMVRISSTKDVCATYRDLWRVIIKDPTSFVIGTDLDQSSGKDVSPSQCENPSDPDGLREESRDTQ